MQGVWVMRLGLPRAVACDSARPLRAFTLDSLTRYSRESLYTENDVLLSPLGRRRAGGSYLLVDLVCQAAAGRSYIKVTLPQGFPQQQQQQPQQQQPSAQAAQAAAAAAAAAGGTDNPGAAAAAAMAAGTAGLLVAVQHLAVGKLGRAVSVSVGGRGALPTGLGYRPRPAPGPGCPLWLLVPNDSVQQVVELVYGVMRGPGGEQHALQQQAQGQGGQQGQGQQQGAAT